MGGNGAKSNKTGQGVTRTGPWRANARNEHAQLGWEPGTGSRLLVREGLEPAPLGSGWKTWDNTTLWGDSWRSVPTGRGRGGGLLGLCHLKPDWTKHPGTPRRGRFLSALPGHCMAGAREGSGNGAPSPDSLGIGDGGVFGEAEVVGDVFVVGQPAVGSQQAVGAHRDLGKGREASRRTQGAQPPGLQPRSWESATGHGKAGAGQDLCFTTSSKGSTHVPQHQDGSSMATLPHWAIPGCPSQVPAGPDPT